MYCTEKVHNRILRMRINGSWRGGARYDMPTLSNHESDRFFRGMEMEGDGVAIGDQLLLACQNGDAHTLQTMMSSVPGLDLSATAEDGVTFLMHTIIGAGE